uniref:T-cell leukemia translocation-altered gene protein homolog n=2 Tax=Cavia porcellus TaxID=10141 RepID=A0A286XTM9_CAVPO
MAEPWFGQSLQALPSAVVGALGALGSEFLREWEAQDMRVTLFKLLLLWLVLSLLGIQLAWGFYGNTVTGLYHRPDPHSQPAAALDVFLPPGLGGQNGSTPDGSTHFPSW